jgi:hypothetical protein
VCSAAICSTPRSLCTMARPQNAQVLIADFVEMPAKLAGNLVKLRRSNAFVALSVCPPFGRIRGNYLRASLRAALPKA